MGGYLNHGQDTDGGDHVKLNRMKDKYVSIEDVGEELIHGLNESTELNVNKWLQKPEKDCTGVVETNLEEKCFNFKELICRLNRRIDSMMADEMTVPPDSESRETPTDTYPKPGRLDEETLDWSSLGKLSPKHKEGKLL